MQELNVQQPSSNNYRPSNNETIVEEQTGEDESMLRNSRFSKKLGEDEDIDLLPRNSYNLRAS